MLEDRSRKLLQIIYHNLRSGHVPSTIELSRKTGGTVGEIKMTLRVLVNKQYITWDPNHHHDLKIIRLPETPNLIKPEKQKKFWEYD